MKPQFEFVVLQIAAVAALRQLQHALRGVHPAVLLIETDIGEVRPADAPGSGFQFRSAAGQGSFCRYRCRRSGGCARRCGSPAKAVRATTGGRAHIRNSGRRPEPAVCLREAARRRNLSSARTASAAGGAVRPDAPGCPRSVPHVYRRAAPRSVRRSPSSSGAGCAEAGPCAVRPDASAAPDARGPPAPFCGPAAGPPVRNRPAGPAPPPRSVCVLGKNHSRRRRLSAPSQRVRRSCRAG